MLLDEIVFERPGPVMLVFFVLLSVGAGVFLSAWLASAVGLKGPAHAATILGLNFVLEPVLVCSGVVAAILVKTVIVRVGNRRSRSELRD